MNLITLLTPIFAPVLHIIWVLWNIHVTFVNASLDTSEWIQSSCATHCNILHHNATRCNAHSTHTCHIYEWVFRHVWTNPINLLPPTFHFRTAYHMSHVTHMCRIYEWVMTHIWMSPTTLLSRNICCRTTYKCHIHESCQTYMSHLCMNHHTHTSESCHFDLSQLSLRTTYKYRTREPFHTYMSHLWMSHDTHICHIYEWVMTHVGKSLITLVFNL